MSEPRCATQIDDKVISKALSSKADGPLYRSQVARDANAVKARRVKERDECLNAFTRYT